MYTVLTGIGNAISNTLMSQVIPEVQSVVNAALYIVAIILLVSLIVRAAMLWKAHHSGEELNWIPLILLFIGLVVVVSAPSWMWSIIG